MCLSYYINFIAILPMLTGSDNSYGVIFKCVVNKRFMLESFIFAHDPIIRWVRDAGHEHGPSNNIFTPYNPS